MNSFIILLLFSSFVLLESYKFLGYCPQVGKSHVNFLGKFADTLIDAGHEVHLLVPVIETTVVQSIPTKAKQIRIPQCRESVEFTKKLEDGEMGNVWLDDSVQKLMKSLQLFTETMLAQCNATINYPGLIEQLKNEHYDVAYTEILDVCAPGIFHLASINKFVITQSIATMEGYYFMTGMATNPAYVPGVMAYYGDKMSFWERLVNTFSLSMFLTISPFLYQSYTDLYRRELGPIFPDIQEILANNSLIFLNSEPLIDFPRPTTHKIIEIGGFTASKSVPLNSTWSDILDLRKHTILVSFGTIAEAYKMPKEYKDGLLEVFKQFPDVTFIWKYEKPEHRIADGISNVITSTWIPQKDMLKDPRLDLFITHGGLGSTNEAVTAGIPLICIPVMGDQNRNAQIIKRHGNGVIVEKKQLAESAALANAIAEVLKNPSYRQASQRLSKMISKRPFQMSKVLVKNMEFVAQFGPLRNYDHYGQKLSFIQYYLVDVIAFLLMCLFLVLLFIFYVLRCLMRTMCKSKEKRE